MLFAQDGSARSSGDGQDARRFTPIKWKGFSKGELAEHYKKHVIEQGEFGDITQDAPAGATLLTFSIAAQQRRRVSMRYRAWSDRETERALDPYGVVFYDGRWFAVGYCHLRAGLRMFRLDRVLGAGLRDERFTRPDDFDSLAYLVYSLATAPGTWSVEVRLLTTLDEARQHVPASMATLEPAPEGVVLRCHVQSLDWIARFLVGLGCPMVVRRPPELREALRKLAAEVAEAAERGE